MSEVLDVVEELIDEERRGRKEESWERNARLLNASEYRANGFPVLRSQQRRGQRTGQSAVLAYGITPRWLGHASEAASRPKKFSADVDKLLQITIPSAINKGKRVPPALFQPFIHHNFCITRPPPNNTFDNQLSPLPTHQPIPKSIKMTGGKSGGKASGSKNAQS